MSDIHSPQNFSQASEKWSQNPDNFGLPENSETKKAFEKFHKKLYRKFAEIFLWDGTIAMSQKEWDEEARREISEFRQMLAENNPTNARFSQSEIWFENDLSQMAEKHKAKMSKNDKK